MCNHLNKTILLPFILIFANCNLGSQSEIITYIGIVRLSDTNVIPDSIEIFCGNKDERILDENGNLEPYFISPSYPDDSGRYIVGTTTYSHGPNESVEQWQCAPLRLLIRHPYYIQYYDSLSENELKQLSANSKGQWILPEITIQRKP